MTHPSGAPPVGMSSLQHLLATALISIIPKKGTRLIGYNVPYLKTHVAIYLACHSLPFNICSNAVHATEKKQMGLGLSKSYSYPFLITDTKLFSNHIILYEYVEDLGKETSNT